MEMERVHPLSTNKYQKTGPRLEPPRQEKERVTKEHLASWPPGWHHKDQPLMEPVKKDGPEQRYVSGGLLLKPYVLRGAMDLDR